MNQTDMVMCIVNVIFRIFRTSGGRSYEIEFTCHLMHQQGKPLFSIYDIRTLTISQILFTTIQQSGSFQLFLLCISVSLWTMRSKFFKSMLARKPTIFEISTFPWSRQFFTVDHCTGQCPGDPIIQTLLFPKISKTGCRIVPMPKPISLQNVNKLQSTRK